MKKRYYIAIIDTTDAYYYADVFDENRYEIFGIEDELKVAKVLADAYFRIKNYMWKSLKEMNKLAGGYDVRIYDENHNCLYKAHEIYKDKWFV